MNGYNANFKAWWATTVHSSYDPGALRYLELTKYDMADAFAAGAASQRAKADRPPSLLRIVFWPWLGAYGR